MRPTLSAVAVIRSYSLQGILQLMALNVYFLFHTFCNFSSEVRTTFHILVHGNHYFCEIILGCKEFKKVLSSKFFKFSLLLLPPLSIDTYQCCSGLFIL
jgi:hypothetical protein